MVMFAQMILIILQVQMGAGRHVDDIAPEDNIEGLHLNFVTQPLCLIALALVKISIGMLLLRLTVSAKFKKFIWATIAFTGLAFIANFCKFASRGLIGPMADLRKWLSCCNVNLWHWCGTETSKAIACELRVSSSLHSSTLVSSHVLSRHAGILTRQ